jgi:probable phosphoglycerate mutase
MRFFIARHGETVHNAAARMQGNEAHAPLTHAGIVQAHAMGARLAALLGTRPDLDIWASSAGRALQTAAIVAEHLGRDYFEIRIDPRLREIEVGDWAGRLYRDIVAESGPILCPERYAFTVRPPGGEVHREVAARLAAWLAALPADRDVLAVTHGMTSRVLRGLLAGGAPFDGVALADSVPQGSIVQIEDGLETLLPPNEKADEKAGAPNDSI